MIKVVLLAALTLSASSSFAMDFSGVEVREIPIRISAAKHKERATILRQPNIAASDWVQMTRDEKVEIAQQMAIIDLLQRLYLKEEAAHDRAADERANPQALCAARFGPEFEYSGRVESLLPDNTKQASYLCTKFGPSQRTPFEKRMIQLKGYIAFVKFKLRHPLSAWAG